MAEQPVPNQNAQTVLVTGASGFIAGHIIKQILQQNYTVRGTVRNLGDHAVKYKYLYDLQTTPNQLQLFAADLCSDDNWDTIIAGCTFIIHVASPVPKRRDAHPLSQQQLIATATHGLRRVLSFSLKHKHAIQRIVLTSSEAAMLPAQGRRARSHNQVQVMRTTDWTDIEVDDVAQWDPSGYKRSKTMAEKLFWQFLADNNAPFEGVAINPSFTIGPLLSGANEPASLATVSALLNGEFPFLPNCGFMFVDVRDVALCHVNALTASNVAGKRYLAANHMLWAKDVALILSGQFAEYRAQISLSVGYDFAWKLIGAFDPVIGGFLVPMLGKLYIAKHEETVRDLGVVFRALNETVIDCADSLIQFGLVKKQSPTRRVVKHTVKAVVVGGIVGAAVYYWNKRMN